jgi:hypothetical protein
MLPSDHSWALQENMIENVLNRFIYLITCVDFPQSFHQFDYMFGEEFQENLDPSTLSLTYLIFVIDEYSRSYTMPYETSPGKFLHINSRLDANQQEQLVNILKDESEAFA